MSLKILSVDDEKDLAFLFQQKFRKQIKSGDIEFLYADEGNEAIEIINVDSRDVHKRIF